ncbi:MAG: L-rhamnose mutarotase [Sphingomonas sp.]
MVTGAGAVGRRIVRVQDLADDTGVFAAYDEAHRPGNTPAAVLDAQRRHGILDLEIYRFANRLVMVMTVSENFDPAALDRESASLSELIEWHRGMGALQRRPAGASSDWPEAALVFRQTDHP